MKHIVAFVIAMCTFSLSACDKLGPKDKGLEEMIKIHQRWFDGVSLAHATARIALSPQVASLQAIRRDLDGVVVSDCLKDAKVALGEHMDLSVQGFLAFMGNEDDRASMTLDRAKEKLVYYDQATAKCR